MEILAPLLGLGIIIGVFQLVHASDRLKAIEERLERVERIPRHTVNGNLKPFEGCAESDLLDYDEDLDENEALAETDDRGIRRRITGLGI